MMKNLFLGKRYEELPHLQLMLERKFNTFAEMVRDDIERTWISESYGLELIVRAIVLVSVFTVK